MQYLMKKKLFDLESEFKIKCDGISKYNTKLVSSNGQKELHISNIHFEEIIKIVASELEKAKEFKICLYGRMILKVNMKDYVNKQILFRSMYGDEYDVIEHKGNLEHNNYIIRKNGLRIAKSFRKPLAQIDEYAIDILEVENQALILAIAIVVDECV
ncbi:hypothetical protein SH2C18_43070 [Clostridium sediminicola]|uniref:hypothetical protein n=1 Tax=Clostridium sediminicola TaxID=3114879 RepID=UPI0031F20028